MKRYIVLAGLLIFLVSSTNLFAQDLVLSVTHIMGGEASDGTYIDTRSTGHHYHFTSRFTNDPYYTENYIATITINDEIVFYRHLGDGGTINFYYPAHK